MESLPREVNLIILNYLIHFFSSKNDSEDQMFQWLVSQWHNVSHRHDLKTHILANIRGILSLSMTNKQWYHLINHKCINRLWKCIHLTLNLSNAKSNAIESLKRCIKAGKDKIKNDPEMTMTQLLKSNCITMFWDLYFAHMTRSFKQLLEQCLNGTNSDSDKVNKQQLSLVLSMMDENPSWLAAQSEEIVLICLLSVPGVASHRNVTIYTVLEHVLQLNNNAIQYLVKGLPKTQNSRHHSVLLYLLNINNNGDNRHWEGATLNVQMIDLYIQLLKKYSLPSRNNVGTIAHLSELDLLFVRAQQATHRPLEFQIANYRDQELIDILKPHLVKHRKRYLYAGRSPYIHLRDTIRSCLQYHYLSKDPSPSLMISILDLLASCGWTLTESKQTTTSCYDPPDLLEFFFHDCCSVSSRYPTSFYRPIISYLTKYLEDNSSKKNSERVHYSNSIILHTILNKVSFSSMESVHAFCTLFGQHHKDLLKKLLLVENSDGMLPISIFLEKFTARRQWVRCVNAHQAPQVRFKIISLMMDNCTDMKVYQQKQVKQQLEQALKATMDDKTPYAKYLKLL